jgi:hypothetical protein
MSVAQASRYRRNGAVEAAPLKNESVLFNPKTNTFCRLNATMAFIWDHLEKPSTSDQISQEVARSFSGVTVEQARADVEKAFAQMLELDLLVTDGDV